MAVKLDSNHPTKVESVKYFYKIQSVSLMTKFFIQFSFDFYIKLLSAGYK